MLHVKPTNSLLNNDVNVIMPFDVDSLADYAPNKSKVLSATTVPLDILTSMYFPDSRAEQSFRFHMHLPPAVSLPSIRRSSTYQRSSTQRSYSEKDTHQRSRSYHDDYDLRLIIIRHGERVDRYFGSNWSKLAFDRDGQYRPYHPNLPEKLPTRQHQIWWSEDTPLTNSGLQAAETLGRKLTVHCIQPTYVYSSPAMRCVLTTIEILKGLQLDKTLAIRIEPGLLELGAARFGMNIFFQPIDWYQYGVNVDLSYQPRITRIDRYESESAYYMRAKTVVRHIEQEVQNGLSRRQHILIVGHATSSETLTWDLIGKQPNVYHLYELSLKIGYLQTMMAKRKRKNHRWSLKRII
jgi:broad specificity phosphatase PhoE